ncbi:MAG: electron transport complex subunit RsxB [Methylococcaceae bacterium]|nr:electron transport complex subunit RsxB [Methylococcaceae bacterium]MDZ4156803.1 electron transport complex subunit RsxB [Methylococcales bacterium]MDP2393293.1 electron transport complex subunit RsxB [Methylococcaceae bacterium]MDP3018387.1 electron transport complex subunit RsxB [Methylococcaceae bacterium]MDP3389303.1 electron transport complex subunit RsxB [Methylococcaceae bacterium]
MFPQHNPSLKDTVIEQINNTLPQTQCGQCGYNGCRPYAEAIASGTADINQCPPGGEEGIVALAQLLNVSPKPLNPAFGEHKPKSVAFIIEEDCIGCTKCIAACPVDAILGAAKYMHTVIASECTGCELCLAPCPVDCIVMQPLLEPLSAAEKTTRAQLAKRRYEARNLRKQREEAENLERARQKKAAFLKLKAAG